MAEKNVTPFQKELVEIAKKIKEYSSSAEGNVIGIIYKKPEILFESNLVGDDFMNDIYKIYFMIAYNLVVNDGKKSLDSMTVGFYLEQHPKLKSKYDKYDGYETLKVLQDCAVEENFDGYVNEMRKWNVVLRLAKENMVSKDKLSDYADMSAEEIYDEFETFLNHTFINIDSEVPSYNVLDGINELIEDMDNGTSFGMRIRNFDLLTNEIAGINKGHIYGLGAASGVGKSTLAFNMLVPSAMPSAIDKHVDPSNDRPVVFMINEEDETKFRREMLIWVANNVFEMGLQKYMLRNGNFSDELKEKLYKCAEWIDEQKDRQHIIVIPLTRYSVNLAIKIINKYAAMDPETVFCLDTFKESADSKTDEIYKSMMRDMIALYDTIKPANKNVPLFVTYQLGKQSLKLRHLTNLEIGQARSIVDVMSVNLMCRKPYDDEYHKRSKELFCYHYSDMNKTGPKIKNVLTRDQNPMIIFIAKNRFGITDQYQILADCNFGTNVCKDFAYCEVPQDY